MLTNCHVDNTYRLYNDDDDDDDDDDDNNNNNNNVSSVQLFAK
jgi:hypothetical protein